MTFLELCQNVRREAGISGDGPVTVANQSGELGRVVNWVKTAWQELQISRPDWRFMKGNFSFTTTSGKAEYSAVEAGISASTGRFRKFDINSLRVYRDGDSTQTELPIMYVPYQEYLDVLKPGASQGTPLIFSVTPQDKLVFSDTPNGAYIVSGEYVKKPQVLAEGSDELDMPDQFHYLVVYRALAKYALFMAASEVLAYAEKEANTYFNALVLDQTPDYYLAE